MKNKILLFFSCLLLIISTAIAQTVSTPSSTFECGTDVLRKKMMRENPQLRIKSEQFELFYQDFVLRQNTLDLKNRNTPLYTIPVVFHIFHEGETLGEIYNPTDDIFQSKILELNLYFSHFFGSVYPNNPYSGVDTQIEYCLAQRTPTGTATTGIVRYNNSSIANPSSSNVLLNELPNYLWDITKYCNIFLIKNSPPDYSFAGVTVGGGGHDEIIVVSPTFAAGGESVTIHELGHYFNLAHPFQGGCPNANCLLEGDFVCDTPPRDPAIPLGSCDTPNNSCDTDDDDLSSNNPLRPVASGGIGDRLDGYENYMDYITPCRGSFTQGQKVRMHASIIAQRISLVTNNNACDAVLAVDLAYFVVKAEQNKALLTWQTASETNVKNFDIEKSLDGQKFEKIAEVKANNTPSVYQAFDHQFLESAYYRLKINDLDGTTNHSKTVFLEKNGAKTIKISRNTEGGIWIETDDKIESVILTNNIGQVLKTTKDNRMGLTDLPTGIYIISVKTNKSFVSQKILNF